MAARNLEQRLSEAGNAVAMLRDSPEEAFVFPMRSEFSNWIDEQEAWNTTAVLFDQSFHMTDLYVSGPDTIRLLSHLGVNSFKGFRRDKAKQLVCCNYDGYVIGDCIVFGLEDDKVQLVGRPAVANWVTFHAETGDWDVTLVRDERSAANARPRLTYRYEVQGPNAWAILEKVNGGPIEGIKFFTMGEINVAGRRVRCLRHGMSGAPGLELFGPEADGPEVHAALLAAGGEFGMRQAGARAYATANSESGWWSSPLPAIYTGEAMRAYREWLPAQGFEANGSIGGSMVSADIADYYVTPYDLGYGHFTRFDHDFIGAAALERLATRPSRKKVTLTWNDDDILAVYASMFRKEGRIKYMDLPAARYATYPYDTVMADGEKIGVSAYCCYTSNGRCWISLALVDEKHAAPGTEVSVIWGEPDGGSAKPSVERHVQAEIRATVGPAPFPAAARETYRPYLRPKV